MSGCRELLRGLLSPMGSELESALSCRGQNDRVDALSLVCRSVLRSGPFAVIDGDIHYRSGRVYVPCSRRDLVSALGDVLVDLGVSPTDVRRMGDMPLSVLGGRVCPRSSLIAFENGVLDLRGMVFRPEAPDGVAVTESLPYSYASPGTPGAMCPRWESFLAESLPDASVRAVLQEFLGCCYTDRAELSIERFGVFLGPGANGKSVARDVVAAAMGRGNVSSFDAEQITRPELLPYLNGKRINFASDMRASAAFDSALKALASGQEVTGRKIYGEPVTVKAPPIVFSMNALPPFRDTTDAFFRRMLLFRFDRVVPESRRDAGLASGIIATELPGVFAWLMEGKARIELSRGRFTPSAAMDSALSAVRGSVVDAAYPARSWLEGQGYTLVPEREGQPSVLVSQNEIDSGLRGTVSRYMITAELKRLGVRTFRSKELFYRVYKRGG